MSFGEKIAKATPEQLPDILGSAFAAMSMIINHVLNSIPADDLPIFLACMEMSCATLRGVYPDMNAVIDGMKENMGCIASPKME